MKIIIVNMTVIVPDSEQKINTDVEEEEVVEESEDIKDCMNDDSHQTIEKSDEDNCNESNRPSRLRGRPRGITKEMMESRDRLRKIKLQEKDDQTNVRRSERIKEKLQVTLTQ